MNSVQIRNIYKENGLTDYTLRNTDDLLICHDIDFKKVEGYNSLNNINRIIYKKFIINFFNVWGLVSRATLLPKAIYFVEEIEYLTKFGTVNNYCYLGLGGVIKVIDRNGLNYILRSWYDEDHKYFKIFDTETKNIYALSMN